MKVAAKRATSYSFRGLRYIWETPGQVLELPDELGKHLVGRADGLFEEVVITEPEPEQPTRAAAPEVGHTTEAGGISKMPEAPDGNTED